MCYTKFPVVQETFCYGTQIGNSCVINKFTIKEIKFFASEAVMDFTLKEKKVLRLVVHYLKYSEISLSNFDSKLPIQNLVLNSKI